MHIPGYSRVWSSGRTCGNSLAWTSFAIWSSCAARRSASISEQAHDVVPQLVVWPGYQARELPFSLTLEKDAPLSVQEAKPGGTLRE
jgi:hypothetical protein